MTFQIHPESWKGVMGEDRGAKGLTLRDKQDMILFKREGY
jgi:hypothetical protein